MLHVLETTILLCYLVVLSCCAILLCIITKKIAAKTKVESGSSMAQKTTCCGRILVVFSLLKIKSSIQSLRTNDLPTRRLMYVYVCICLHVCMYIHICRRWAQRAREILHALVETALCTQTISGRHRHSSCERSRHAKFDTLFQRPCGLGKSAHTQEERCEEDVWPRVAEGA